MPRATLREMLEAGVHFGHQTRYWNPAMAPYIFGERNKIHILNLEITQRLLDEAAGAARQFAAEGKTILIVGTKRSAQDIVRAKAQECDIPYVTHRWLGGTLTNFHTVRNSVKRLQDLRRMESEGLRKRLSKKEALRLDREQMKLNRSLGGIEHMERLPDALFVIDVRYENIAVREAQRLNIPVIAVVDSNSSTDGVDYVIPGNDDAIRSVQLYMNVICDAIMEGRQQALEESTAVQVEVRPKASSERKGKRATLRARPKEDGDGEQALKEEAAQEKPEEEEEESAVEESESEEVAESTAEELVSEPEAESETDEKAADASEAPSEAEPEEAPDAEEEKEDAA